MIDDTDRHAKAYALWEKEGRPEGRHLDHWQAAGIKEDSVDETEVSAGEDPAEGSEDIVDRELSHQGKRPDQSAG